MDIDLYLCMFYINIYCIFISVTTTPQPTPHPLSQYQYATWSLVGAALVALFVLVALSITLWRRSKSETELWRDHRLKCSALYHHGSEANHHTLWLEELDHRSLGRGFESGLCVGRLSSSLIMHVPSDWLSVLATLMFTMVIINIIFTFNCCLITAYNTTCNSGHLLKTGTYSMGTDNPSVFNPRWCLWTLSNHDSSGQTLVSPD